jgi:DNA-binding FadR family transcriptional regulator
VVTNLLESELLRFIASNGYAPGDKLPSLGELSNRLGISVGKLREQLEVARTLGVVEVRPRTGIRVLPFTFFPAVRQSLLYALAIDPAAFDTFSSLRRHVEASFWHEAVTRLTTEDVTHLRELIRLAQAKLNGHPIQIPHAEHKQLHLTIYGRLHNPFVQGVLEAYWEAYEAIELNLYADYAYLQQVWQYHERIVEAIAGGDRDAGYQALVEHAELLPYLEHHASPAPPEAATGDGRLRSVKAGRAAHARNAASE